METYAVYRTIKPFQGYFFANYNCSNFSVFRHRLCIHNSNIAIVNPGVNHTVALHAQCK